MKMMMMMMMMMTIDIVFVCFVMVLSAAEEVKKNLTAVVGGNITLDHPVLEEGFLSFGAKTIAEVENKILKIEEDDYQKRVLWNQTSGLFTITKLQRSDSGPYTIELITPHRLITYLLTVIEPQPGPGPGPGPVPTAEPTPTTRRYWIVGVSVGGFLIGVVFVFLSKMFLQSHSRNKHPGMRADPEPAELQNQEKQKSRKEEEESEEMMKTGPADEEELTAAAEHHQS